MYTYPHVELNDAPQYQHRRITVAVLDVVDLEISLYGTDCRKEPQQKDADEAEFLLVANVQTEEDRDRDKGDDDIGDDGDDGIASEGRTWGEALSLDCRVPGLLYL